MHKNSQKNMKTLTLTKGSSPSYEREIINVEAIEKIAVHTEKCREAQRANYTGGYCMPYDASSRAALTCKNQSGVLHLKSGKEIPLVDEELTLALEAVGDSQLSPAQA